MISCEQNPAWLEFANKVLGVGFDVAQAVWITHLVDDKPVAVAVYNRFSAYNCEMSIATDGGRRWASRAFLRSCYLYPFVQLGLKRVSAVVEEKNTKSLTLCRKLGHAEEARLMAWFGEQDGILFRMMKEDCKWL